MPACLLGRNANEVKETKGLFFFEPVCLYFQPSNFKMMNDIFQASDIGFFSKLAQLIKLLLSNKKI